MKCKRSYCTNSNYVSWLFYALQMQRPTLLKLDRLRTPKQLPALPVVPSVPLEKCLLWSLIGIGAKLALGLNY